MISSGSQASHLDTSRVYFGIMICFLSPSVMHIMPTGYCAQYFSPLQAVSSLLALLVLKWHSAVIFSLPSVSFSFFCGGGPFLKSASSFACGSAGAQRCHSEHHARFSYSLENCRIRVLEAHAFLPSLCRIFTISPNWQFELFSMIQWTAMSLVAMEAFHHMASHSDKPINTQ